MQELALAFFVCAGIGIPAQIVIAIKLTCDLASTCKLSRRGGACLFPFLLRHVAEGRQGLETLALHFL